MAAKKPDMPSVLAFEKKLAPSDGFMYGTDWEDCNSKETPLKLIEKSVRGTISNRLKKKLMADPAKLDQEVEKPNLQTVDACALGLDEDTLKLRFTLKVLSGVESPSACNNMEFQKTYAEAVKEYVEKHGFRELARRYAVNIANARFLWRNRLGAESIVVRVKVLNDGIDKEWKFDATTIGIRDFKTDAPGLTELAENIASALSGGLPFLMLDVECFARAGMAQEVYPSEELVLDKGKGQKSKVLYSIDGIAGMHSQKIGNALRTIDTWYPGYGEELDAPIAVEPYGAVTSMGKAYRTPKNKADFYTLFDEWARGGKLNSEEEEHYIMAMLVRGGVFGEGGKGDE